MFCLSKWFQFNCWKLCENYLSASILPELQSNYQCVSPMHSWICSYQKWNSLYAWKLSQYGWSWSHLHQLYPRYALVKWAMQNVDRFLFEIPKRILHSMLNLVNFATKPLCAPILFKLQLSTRNLSDMFSKLHPFVKALLSINSILSTIHFIGYMPTMFIRLHSNNQWTPMHIDTSARMFRPKLKQLWSLYVQILWEWNPMYRVCEILYQYWSFGSMYFLLLRLIAYQWHLCSWPKYQVLCQTDWWAVPTMSKWVHLLCFLWVLSPCVTQLQKLQLQWNVHNMWR